ncbi:dTDP-4-dehydrorhamnose reductase [Legionella anisa]|uniref:dTDP-4-dehydrorhamnose reductase n=1 Tax=Legionella anisa TaxID=28082 RepID=A0AAX0WUV3_9GAMM|nr:dTDP-4-dehydrorhamnose reductase [Legionella anisa]AWN73968.1 dTDP-4-dehydrorhamnose reductase [Legionella anisa]KTC67237.1 dTDP-4-keto-L-rhamnose reductase [Legionella anisa]MBN5934093.1 dTDP-4-dehydrorhamnose reductase [Legionella anisa]MCW8426015.1 dTDP-4-dehydrorhamnose reductase [Legionella anisa]MCW8448551.1 dTDP-4-dehydrorhamnose reductase [Legionella anisa]
MKILIIGANGQVGSEIIQLFMSTEHQIVPLTRKELDCVHVSEVISTLSLIQPELIINASAYTAVDKAEDEVMLAHRINEEFVRQLALYCAQKKIALIHLSTDYVFDGTKKGAYSETDSTHPQGVYAQSKLAGEQAITSLLNEYIILRVSWVFGVYGANFVKTILKLASSREELSVVADQWGRPTAAQDIARVLLAIVAKISTPPFNDWGVYHYAGAGVTNWYEFSCFFIDLAKKKGMSLTLSHLRPIKSEEYVTKAKRPKNSVLNTTKIEQILNIQCRSWKDYLPGVVERFMEQNIS